MARIAFFTEALPSEGGSIAQYAWDLIRSLADQQHEIRVFATYRENTDLPERHPRIEILRPFKHWGVSELTRVAPLLMQYRPEILHFIQPHREALSGFTNAMSFIPGLTPMLGRPPVIVSFFDFTGKHLHQHRVLLGMADALTVTNARQKESIAAFFQQRPPPPIEIVPIGFSSSERITSEARLPTEIYPSSTPKGSERGSGLRLELARLLNEECGLVVVPGSVDQHHNVAFLFETLAMSLRERPAAHAVITGGWGTTPLRQRHAAEDRLFKAGVAGRLLLLGPSDRDVEPELLRRASAVLVATLDETRLGFMQILRSGQHEAGTLILNSEQASLDPIAWADEVNALLRPRSIQHLHQAIVELLDRPELQQRLRRNVAELARTHVVDLPGNVMSRLYARTLALQL